MTNQVSRGSTKAPYHVFYILQCKAAEIGLDWRWEMGWSTWVLLWQSDISQMPKSLGFQVKFLVGFAVRNKCPLNPDYEEAGMTGMTRGLFPLQQRSSDHGLLP